MIYIIYIQKIQSIIFLVIYEIISFLLKWFQETKVLEELIFGQKYIHLELIKR